MRHTPCSRVHSRTFGLISPLALAAIVLLPAGACLAGPVVSQGFAGPNLADGHSLTGFNYAPPDSCGAAGLNHFVVFVNGAFAVYNKSTGALAQPMITDATFWGNQGITSTAGFSDTRIIFDPLSQRWFATELSTESLNNRILVSRSDTSDPTGTWKAVTLHATNNRFADFPLMGIDANGVYISVNNFDALSNITGVSIYSMPKAGLLLSTPSVANATIFSDKSLSQYGVSPQPIIDFAPTKVGTALYGTDSSLFTGTASTNLKHCTLTGTTAAGATLSAGANLTVNSYNRPMDGAPQPDGTFDIDSLDGRFVSSGYQVGSDIWIVHAVDAGVAFNHRCGLVWYRYSDTTDALLASGLIADPSYDFYNASMAANANGDVVIGCTRSGTAATGAAGNASAVAIVGQTSGTATTFGSPIMLKQGLVDNYHLFGGLRERWGDRSSVTVDPTNSNIFWATQEYAVGASEWGNWAASITVPEPLTLSLLALGGLALLRRSRKS